MKYWTETCPCCGARFRCSDLHNSKDYASPIVTCSKCHKLYIHPDRIELGMVPEERWKAYKREEITTPSFYLVFISFILACILQWIGESYIFKESLSLNYLLINTILFSCILVPVFIIRHGKYLEKQLELSKERLKQPGYREVLVNARYTVKHWVND